MYSVRSPVVPGDQLETSIWLRKRDGNTTVLDFVQKVNGKPCLSGGVAVLEQVEESAKM